MKHDVKHDVTSIETNAAVVEMNDMDNNVGMNSEKRSRYIDFQDLARLSRCVDYHHIIIIIILHNLCTPFIFYPFTA
jgi:hypothetical protein